MEPKLVEDYARQGYWDERYAKEESYDWFQSIYGESVDKLSEIVVNRIALPKKKQLVGESGADAVTVNVLHLGCGNSCLSFDLLRKCAKLWSQQEQQAEEGKPKKKLLLRQFAIDYSPVVIERMQKRTQEFVAQTADDTVLQSAIAGWPQAAAAQAKSDSGASSSSSLFEWHTMDMRQLKAPIKGDDNKGCCFDLVIDKATLDALQADKSDEEQMERDTQQLLEEVASVMRGPSGSEATPPCYSHFVQITWEVPQFRFFYTKRDEFGWVGEFSEPTGEKGGTTATSPYVVKFDNDTYRMIVYVKGSTK